MYAHCMGLHGITIDIPYYGKAGSSAGFVRVCSFLCAFLMNAGGCSYLFQRRLPAQTDCLPSLAWKHKSNILAGGILKLLNVRLSKVFSCRLRNAEDAVLEAGGIAIRLVGLYHAQRQVNVRRNTLQNPFGHYMRPITSSPKLACGV